MFLNGSLNLQYFEQIGPDSFIPNVVSSFTLIFPTENCAMIVLKKVYT